MHLPPPVLGGVLLLAASPLAGGEVDVRVAGDRVSLNAVAAPLAEVLESLARRTGMRLTYDTPPPRQTLTARFENRTPAEAVLSVLEGLGLNYALVMDPGGTRVDQLLILGAAGIATAAAPATPGRPGAPGRPQRPMTPEQEMMQELEEEEDAGEPADAMDEMSVLEAAREAEVEAAPEAPQSPAMLPRVPEYPASSFSPRLPLPTPPPAPTPSPQPTPSNATRQ